MTATVLLIIAFAVLSGVACFFAGLAVDSPLTRHLINKHAQAYHDAKNAQNSWGLLHNYHRQLLDWTQNAKIDENDPLFDFLDNYIDAHWDLNSDLENLVSNLEKE